MTAARRLTRLILSLLAGLLLAGGVTTTAHAEDIYRYWAYYQWGSGKWVFAQKGAEAVVPADGAVEGWRFAAHRFPTRPPRAAGDFEAICGPVEPVAGKKRVALVVDPGTPADSVGTAVPGPATGTCVVIDAKATGAKVLAAAMKVRIERGLTCAINGYPPKGCGDKVTNVTVPATDAAVQLEITAPVGTAVGSTESPNPQPGGVQDADPQDTDRAAWVTIVPIAIIVLVLAGGAYYLTRRRRSGDA
jgi:hypothetical protein